MSRTAEYDPGAPAGGWAQRPAVSAPPKRKDRWLVAAGVVLLLYALMGKGAGYIGVPPLFIGEFLLAGGVGALAAYGRFRGLKLPALLWAVTALSAWGLARTLPFVSAYGVDALRDAVIWGYAAFAFLWFFYLLSEPGRFVTLLGMYRTFATVALVGMPALWLVRFVLADATPRWPWADSTVLEPKPGDIMVHLCGIFAFWVSRPGRTVGRGKLLLFGLCAGVMGAYERAAMFAFASVFLLCAFHRPGHRMLRSLVGIGAVAIAALAITDARYEVPVADSIKVREISFEQFAANITGVLFPSNMGDMDDTKEWRLNWWKEIVGYTLKGRYFWTGKGFGVNLADDDGFQVMDDHSLRSPHSAHMMILARAGVPGLALWGVIQLGWAYSVRRALARCLRQGDHRWAGVFLFLLAYWLAFIINGSFDVFLEGPMGGIWFWSVYGVGLAALWLRERRPDLLYDRQWDDVNPYAS